MWLVCVVSEGGGGAGVASGLNLWMWLSKGGCG